MIWRTDLRRSLKGLFGLALVCALVAPHSAVGGTISNVANASWRVGDTRQSVQSNEVSFAVRTPPPAMRVRTFVPQPGANGSVDLLANYCAGRPGTSGPLAVSPGAGLTVSTPVVESSSVRAGLQMVLQIEAPAANLDPASVDTLDLLIASQTGDAERVRAIETAANSGVFLASIATTANLEPIVHHDCQLAVQNHSAITVRTLGEDGAAGTTIASLEALADPLGVVFDSVTGAPVNGAVVTLIDARTGTPAKVFAFDGVTPYPSSITTGSVVTDAAGRTYPMGDGAYQFPLAPLGDYRLVVSPPAPYTAPSAATAEQIASLPRPGGGAFTILPASYGAIFALTSLDPLLVDIPVDGPRGELVIRKTASRDRAQPGDNVVYRVTLTNRDPARPSGPIVLDDLASAALRLRAGSVRVNNAAVAEDALEMAGTGRGYALELPSLAPGQSHTVTYMMSVRPDASAGVAINTATATNGGTRQSAQARLRITRSGLASRMTLIGRVTEGGCVDPAQARGIPGVRVMLQDGSFAVTDAEGRYNFEGLVPGTHVAQLQPHTLPEGSRAVDCTRTTRSAGSATSRFVRGQGGSLAVADFHVDLPEGALDALFAAPALPMPAQPDAENEAETAPASIDWLAQGDGPDGFLSPAADANPRSPAIRVAVRHRADASAALLVNGAPAPALAFEGTQRQPSGAYAVSHWRGIHLSGAETRLDAVLTRGEDTQTLTQAVHFADTPMRAAIVPELSNLIADGTTAPVLALRLTDRNGRPVHAGISGAFTLDGPYRSASEAQASRLLALNNFGGSDARWVIEGDDGIARIALEPTLISGSFSVTLNFADGESRRTQQIDAWMQPGDQPWTLIGLVEGSAGAQSVADAMERGEDFSSDLGGDARVALYAKGRVLGRYLLTVAYDSMKQADDQPLLGIIDPTAYYTIFADGSQRAFDAQSREKLYVRVETSAFYALYGDFLTGFVNTSLAHYQRTATGVKAEAQFGAVQAQAFAAEIATRHRRDEIQGNGLTGPYRLSSRYILPGSERVVVEVRDRLRSEVITERRVLMRFVDYTLDMLSGTITLAQPLAGRDEALDPQFLVIDYEVDEQGQAQWNGGVRTTWTGMGGALELGATAISDRGEAERANLGAVDMRLHLDAATEVRAELALSDGASGSGNAWLAEMRHQSGNRDISAYVRQVDSDFGVGQQNLAERGRRKIGADARVELVEGLSAVAALWREDNLDNSANREAGELRLLRRTESTDMFAGIAHLSDTRADGAAATSTVLEAGATQRLFDNQLEVSGTTSVALGGADAIDLPNRHTLGLRYAVTSDVRAIASYEIAQGAALDSRNLQAGLEFAPIRGSRVITTLGRQSLGADAARSYAAFSLGQTLGLSEAVSFDLLVDGNRTLSGGIALPNVANPAHPVSSGGYLGQSGALGEDYTAYSMGANIRLDQWSARARAELRTGEYADRRGLSAAILRDLGEGKVAGGGFTWSRASTAAGTSVTVSDAALSVAWRPAASTFAMLGKAEYRSDRVVGAVAGEIGPAGRSSLTLDGDARSRRFILSTSTNWAPRGQDRLRPSEVGVFAAVRHDLDSVEGYSAKGTSLLGGFDLRIAVGEHIEVGGRANVRANLAEGSTHFSVGPEVGISPVPDMLLTVGYNITGFRDADFGEARQTNRGIYANVRLKFDQDLFGLLGRRQ
ncbi:hypothetical protein [Alteraurantiacibacter palmitatis]|uniref:DUF11 domain-containing protein n=1 Tax=Alteraurantiacibacter palmitatis TaxID=2054628 RepID=A0ABV7E4R4_9SPHN